MTKVCLELYRERALKIFTVQSAHDLVSMDFPGYSIGGLAVGEIRKRNSAVLDDFTTTATINLAI